MFARNKSNFVLWVGLILGLHRRPRPHERTAQKSRLHSVRMRMCGLRKADDFWGPDGGDPLFYAIRICLRTFRMRTRAPPFTPVCGCVRWESQTPQVRIIFLNFFKNLPLADATKPRRSRVCIPAAPSSHPLPILLHMVWVLREIVVRLSL